MLLADRKQIHVRKCKHLGMSEYVFDYKNCYAVVALGITEKEDKKWATVYMIETEPAHRNEGQAQTLLATLKHDFEREGYEFGCTVALNDTMKHILQKLNITEYTEF